MRLFSKRGMVCLIVAAGALFAPACKKEETPGPEPLVSMGSTISVGNLKYTVFQTEWKDTLESDQTPRTPRNKFLLLHVAVENSTSEEAGIPLLTLVNEKGETINEESDGKGVSDWLGYLRTVGAKGTSRGVILFDAAQTSYKVRVSSSGDPEHEKTALVDLPLRIDVETPQNAPGPSPALSK